MFEFMTPTKIIFGAGSLLHALPQIRQIGYSILLVSGRTQERAQPIVQDFQKHHKRYQHVAVSSEPNITMIEETASLARRFKVDAVVAIGGGSVLDTGKALAAIIPNQGSVYDYVEVIGRSVPLKAKPLPFIAIPTTASTGSEVTKNAVLRSGQDKIKVSLRSADMMPDVAIVDPTLTYGTNLYLSGRGAMDAFTHLMEAYVCGVPNLLTDMVCEEGLSRIAHSIIDACVLDEPKARRDLSFAAMLGGLALSNAKLGAAHGLASALGGKLDAPHSVITARLSPYVMHENIELARQHQADDILQRYYRIAQILTDRRNVNLEDGVLWVNMILERLQLPTLDHFGVCQTSFQDVVRDALQSNSIKGNPLPLTEARLMSILNHVCQCRTRTETEKEQTVEHNAVALIKQTEGQKSGDKQPLERE
ncbi:iron-containing alcohol dehydrogenase [Vibrio tritonius]|uniref:Iron-containing alcohol dehydrogenase n=1 Tax=Vibrio tritonius TaxID=1435069 RepID=A0ABS7YUC3_9VIBR|nr:iron-containing alcohol dehydrogenase [Vibrio tritonius]MCA2017915.1 iron-containing alcohol dehydrogenase [Vibrio tritonius]